MLSYLAEEYSVSAKLRCDLNQKLHNTQDILLFFLFFHVDLLR